MFRHDHISHDYEAIALAGLFQNREEAVAAARSVEKRQSPIARAGDKVQVMGAVAAMQAAWHDEQNSTGSIATRPCKQRKSGAPTVPERERRTPKGGPAAWLGISAPKFGFSFLSQAGVNAKSSGDLTEWLVSCPQKRGRIDKDRGY